uniref:hypothetical protein n=1 Tax=Streptosporangium sp. CA-235898 TaxID=3240073 RepID=UPI003F49668E
MDTSDIDALRAMPAGTERIRAAHKVTTDAIAAAAEHRAEIDKLAAVLYYRHGWKKAPLARAAGMYTTNLFPARVTLPRPPDDLVLSQEDAEAQLAEQSLAYREAQELADNARAIRRDDVVALYEGRIDRKLWETADIARETSSPEADESGMSDSLVKADLLARDVTLRPGKGQRVAALDGPPASLPDIARMLHVTPVRMKNAVQAHKRAGTFPEGAMVGDLYVPQVVAEWWPTTARAAKRAAYAPQGEQLATLARRIGESYDKVKTAVRYAEEDDALPEGVKLDDGTYGEEKFLTWWRARAEALQAGTTLKDLAADLRVDYEWLRQQVRAYRKKHGELPEGVELPYRRWDGEKFVAEVWPSIRKV